MKRKLRIIAGHIVSWGILATLLTIIVYSASDSLWMAIAVVAGSAAGAGVVIGLLALGFWLIHMDDTVCLRCGKFFLPPPTNTDIVCPKCGLHMPRISSEQST